MPDPVKTQLFYLTFTLGRTFFCIHARLSFSYLLQFPRISATFAVCCLMLLLIFC